MFSFVTDLQSHYVPADWKNILEKNPELKVCFLRGLASGVVGLSAIVWVAIVQIVTL
jgi:hypothetical protein